MAPKSSIDSCGVKPNVNAAAEARVRVVRRSTLTRKPDARKYWPCRPRRRWPAGPDLRGRHVVEADRARQRRQVRVGIALAPPAARPAATPRPRGSRRGAGVDGLGGAASDATSARRDGPARAAAAAALGGAGGRGAARGGGARAAGSSPEAAARRRGPSGRQRLRRAREHRRPATPALTRGRKRRRIGRDTTRGRPVRENACGGGVRSRSGVMRASCPRRPGVGNSPPVDAPDTPPTLDAAERRDPRRRPAGAPGARSARTSATSSRRRTPASSACRGAIASCCSRCRPASRCAPSARSDGG